MNYNITIVRKPGSKRLYTSYQFNGQPVVRSTGLPDTPANRTHINKFIIPKYIAALVEGRDPTAVARTLSYYLDKVLENTKIRDKSLSTQATYGSGAKKAIELLGDRPINTYKTSDIESMSNKMQEDGNSQKTIATYLAPLSLAFDEALKNEEIGLNRNPVTLATRPKRKNEKKKKPFALGEVVKMIRASTGEFRKFLTLAFFIGCRHGEILGLKRSHLDVDNNIVSIRKQYNIKFEKQDAELKSKTHDCKVPSVVWNLCGELPSNPEEYIFNIALIKGSTRKWIHDEWYAVLEKAGIKADGRTPYTTRHTFTSIALSSKANPLLIKNNVDHVDLKMIEDVYGTLDFEKENFEDLNDMIQKQISVQNEDDLVS